MIEQYFFLKGYFDKQSKIIEKIFLVIHKLDLSDFKNRYVLSIKTQQFYTAIEDLLKQVAKSFENNVDSIELLMRLNTEVPNIRPAFLSKESYLFLDRLRTFRHVIWHAYDCELDEKQLVNIQSIVNEFYPHFIKDFTTFGQYLNRLIKST